MDPLKEFIGQIEEIIQNFLINEKIEEDLDDYGIKNSPQPQFGDYNTSISFRLAKILRENPKSIAKRLFSYIKADDYTLIQKVEVHGGYVNFFMNNSQYNYLVLKTIEELGLNYGKLEDIDTRQKILIEHTSVNPNKPWHVGHARNAILGDTIARLFKKAGFNIEVQNYIDDTGKQVADTLFAMDYFGIKKIPEDKRIDHWMGNIYVDIYKEMDELEKLKEQYSGKGDSEKLDEVKNKLNIIKEGIEKKIKEVESGKYRKITEMCVKDQLKTAFRLKIFYNLLSWESDIVESGLFEESFSIMKKSEYIDLVESGTLKGCWTLIIDKYMENNPDDEEAKKLFQGMAEPNKVLLRSDGTSTYVSKDIAYQMWKFGLLTRDMKYKVFLKQPNGDNLFTTDPEGEKSGVFGKGDKIINVIGMEQMYEQSCVAIALKIMDFMKEYDNSYHLGYAHVKLKEGRMSGRKGIWTATDEIIDEAVSRARKEIIDRRDDFSKEELEKTSESIGISAVRYALLNQSPTKEIVFDWDTVLSFDGDAGPYLQYAYARTSGIMREAKSRGVNFSTINEKFASLLKEDEEVNLIKDLSTLPFIINKSINEYDPSILTQYTIRLTQAFSKFYTKCPILPIEDQDLREARLIMVQSFRIVLESIFSILGIGTLDKM